MSNRRREEVEYLRRSVTSLSSHQNHLVERLLAQMEFTEGLAGLHPAKAAAWSKLLDKAFGVVSDAVAEGPRARLEKAVRQAEEVLAPVGRVAKEYTIHCVGYAHIDMNWQWSWPETVALTNDTFITALGLMEEFPDFCFSQAQASVYAIIAEHNPPLLEEIRQRVKEGRWEVMATHWVEGDKNLAGGESLARHLLYTRRYMKELFDLEPEDVPLDWECDTFGHAHTIPTVNTRGAANRYYLLRQGRPEKPTVYWWQGPDGSRVLAYFGDKLGGCGGVIGPKLLPYMFTFLEESGLKDFLWIYGCGDHGGGPTRRDILRCHDMDSWPIFPNCRLTTLGKFYDILEANSDKWPVLNQELNFEYTGCYTSQTLIKKVNRLGENTCVETESAAALAYRALGRDYPAEALRKAWLNVLFGQFHDILPGSCVRWARQYQSGLFQDTAAATGMIKTHSFRALASAVDTSFAKRELPVLPPERESITFGAGVGKGTMLGGLSCASHAGDGPRPFVVFNPTAWARTEVVQATIWDVHTGAHAEAVPATAWNIHTGFNPSDLDKQKEFVVRTPSGSILPAQKIGSGELCGHCFVDLVFPAEVAALGYAAYAIEEGLAERPSGSVEIYECPPRHDTHTPTSPAMQNEFLAVEFDSLTGGVVKLLDKTTGCDLACPKDPLGVLEYVLERGGSAWVIGATQERLCPLKVTSLAWSHTGPHLASLVAKIKFRSSDLTVTYTLKAGQPWLEIEVEAMWFERGGPEVGTPSLRMQFPLAVGEAKGRYEIPFGSIERDLNDGSEVPALRWADVSGKAPETNAAVGCALLNDCKYGHSLDGSTLGLTLIRSTYSPDPLPEIGEHTMRMALVPHGKTLKTSELIRMGAAFNHPLQVVSTDVHREKLPPCSGALVTVTPANVVLSSIKKAEDDDALILRLFETAGRKANAKVTLDAAMMGKVTEATEVDLLERPLAPSSAKVATDGFTVTVPASGIASVKVRF